MTGIECAWNVSLQVASFTMSEAGLAPGSTGFVGKHTAGAARPGSVRGLLLREGLPRECASSSKF